MRRSLAAVAWVVWLLGCSAPDSNDERSQPDASGGSGAAGGSGGASSGGNGGSGGNGQWPACSSTTAWLERSEALFYLVIDVSGSMAGSVGGVPKWQATRDAVSAFIDRLPGPVGAGLTLFPNRATSASSTPRPSSFCINLDSDISPLPLGDAGSEQRMKLSAALDGATTGGAAATLDACQGAIGPAGILNAYQAVVLISDGHPTMTADCMGDGTDRTPVDAGPVVEELWSGYHLADIPTFVIGLPGSELTEGASESARRWMSLGAVAGGTAPEGCDPEGPAYCHRDLSSAQGLTSALGDTLAEIEGQVMSCRYPVPEAMDELDPDKVRVTLTPASGAPEALLRDASPDCEQGFRYSAEGRVISLCPGTCERVRATPDAKVALEFGCRTL